MDQRKYSTEKPNNKINIKLLIASMETLTNFKDWSRSRIKFSVLASLSVVNFLQCPPLIRCRVRGNLHVIGGFLYDILALWDHRQVPVSVFMVKINGHFRASEEGPLKISMS